MVRHCIAFGCTSRSSKEDCRGLAWSSLPLSNKDLLQKWLVNIRRENTPLNKNSYLCSKHFEPECFVKSLGGQRMRLKPDAIPTKFIFSAEKPRRKIPYDRQATTTKTKKSSGTARCLNVSKDTTVDINVIDEQLKSIKNTDPIVFKDPLESTESGRPLLVTAAVVRRIQHR
ncbi:THAP domain-containing protein 4 [Stylophora pistillata]|uniref:THAP domain-containing protein 4 n=1 Tax=Stylophora pistillata TaxID=50429 RepID=A0A2B4SAY0_STYPI|nr:THAP domain-containing protein 4 [Stylophora pistillata]